MYKNNATRLLISWSYNINGQSFKKMLTELNTEYCAYITEDNTPLREVTFPSDHLYLYNDLNYYKQKAETFLPLDEDVFAKIQPYEKDAIEIINRWRRSITNNDSYGSIRDAFLTYLTFWNDFIIKNKINLFIVDCTPHIPVTYFPYMLCKAYGIPVILRGMMPFIAGCKVNYYLKDGIEEGVGVLQQKYTEIKKQLEGQNQIDLQEELQNYFYEYGKSNEKIKRVIWYNEKFSLSNKFCSYVDRIKIYTSNRNYKILFNKIKYFIETKRRTRRILNYIAHIEEQPDLTEKFFFFPLHLQPECTTLPQGGIFKEQYIVIKMIADALPEGVKLYVKEHPSFWIMKERLECMSETRSKEFYDKILALKNVRLIDHNYNSLELVDKCECVVTITGTAGFEAIFKHKPTILFGNNFYMNFDYVYNVRNNAECIKAINNIMDGRSDYSERDIRVFLKAMESILVPCGLNVQAHIDNGMPEVMEEDIAILTERIVTYYKENYDK